MRPYLEHLVPPVGLGYILTAIDRAGFDYTFIDIDVNRYTDEEVENIIKTTDFDVAAFGCLVSGYKIVKKLANVIKEKDPNIPIIVGNSVATSIPDTLLSKTKVDIAVMREGDITIVEVLNAIRDKQPLESVDGIYFKKNGEIIKNPPRDVIKDINTIPNVNWDLFEIDKYLEKSKLMVPEPYLHPKEELRAMPVNSARGCFFNCGFCYHVFRGYKYRPRSPKLICDEIQDLKDKYKINFVHFYDEITLYTKRQCWELTQEVIDRGLNDIVYSACTRADLLTENDADLAVQFKKAGFHHIGYSLESADEEILISMQKKIDVEQFKMQTKLLQDAGVLTETSLVIGYPQETPETLQKTFDACYEANIYPSTGYIVPQPDTPIYEYARSAGLIPDEEDYLINVIGDRQDFRINLTKMPKEEIEEIVRKNLKRLSDKLHLGLEEDKLIKTGNYKTVGKSLQDKISGK